MICGKEDKMFSISCSNFDEVFLSCNVVWVRSFLRDNWVLSVKPSSVTLVLWNFSHLLLSTVGGYTESPPCESHSRQYVFRILIVYFSASQTEKYLNHSICPRNKQSYHEYSYTGFSMEVNFYASGINFKGAITVPHGK